MKPNGIFYFMETWKDVIGYEGIYKVSDLGNIFSVIYYGGKLMKPTKNGRGYYLLYLTKDKKRKLHYVHRVVYESFNGLTNLQIDHIIEGNKKDNRLCNLQAIDSRANISKMNLHKKSKSSQYIGVSWFAHVGKWASQIRVNGKNIVLGYFISEKEASNAYNNALKDMKI